MTATGGGMLAWWRIVGVIVGLELRQRLRTTRWKVTFVAVVEVVSLVVFGSLYVAVGLLKESYDEWAVNLYAILMAILTFFGLILAPTLSATAINGDRKDATLALVQHTSITNWQLALGKLLGNWVAAMSLVVIALPYLIWGIVEAPYGVGAGVLGIVVLSVLFLCYGGIGLGFSALTSRPAGSAVLTQSSVFFLILGLPALFGVLFATTAQTHQVIRGVYTYSGTPGTVGEPPQPQAVCRDVRQDETFYHTERTWWLLAPNPFLIVADTVGAHDNPSRTFIDPRDISKPPPSSVAIEAARAISTARAGAFIADRPCASAASSVDAPRKGSY